jgi:dipeptidyl aminopeptidase/acylaminoacyl peptidase
MSAFKILKKPLLLGCFALGISGLVIREADATAEKRSTRFTVADDIGLTRLDQNVLFSPNGRYFVVLSERGRLDLNRPESSIRVYAVDAVEHFLSQPSAAKQIIPLWTMSKSTYREGPIISNVRWLADSSGLVFLVRTASGNNQLFLVNISSRRLQALTLEKQHVTAFDVHGESQFTYTAQSPSVPQRADEAQRAIAITGTGQSLDSLVFPENSSMLSDLSELWAVIEGKRVRVLDASSRRPIPVHLAGQSALRLSPDGHSVVTALTVSTVPSEWEMLYPPPFPTSPHRVRAARQNPYAVNGRMDVSEFVIVDLTNGNVKHLVGAPIGNMVGWAGGSFANWSNDGRSVVLSNTFLPADPRNKAEQFRRPCTAVADLVTEKLTCVERRKVQNEQDDEENWRVDDIHFVSGSREKVTVHYQSGGSTIYVESGDGSWSADPNMFESTPKTGQIDASVKQGLNNPPVLIATDKKANRSRVIWNPNPQLRNLQLGEVSVLKWKDKTGRDWVGGLYKPPDYINGKRYPLVIQTHGFDEEEFRPSGAFPTAFAAQELAAVGFVVLQLEDCNISGPEEGPCQVAGYEAAVQQLTKDGLADPDRVGIIGFSRTCYYVLQALTTSAFHFKAASITDGFDGGYLQYIMGVDSGGNTVAHEADAMIGASPFGTGLVQWSSRSPEFNMDRVQTPLQVVALGRLSLLSMWEPYAALRYLKKPVDLIVLNSSEHVLTNPAARMASQGGAVDWFRFWLQCFEEPDPVKTEQYARWRKLRPGNDSDMKTLDGTARPK